MYWAGLLFFESYLFTLVCVKAVQSVQETRPVIGRSGFEFGPLMEVLIRDSALYFFAYVAAAENSITLL